MPTATRSVSFNAATNNVTLAGTGALSGGTISGLSGGNKLIERGGLHGGRREPDDAGADLYGPERDRDVHGDGDGRRRDVGERDGDARARRRGW